MGAAETGIKSHTMVGHKKQILEAVIFNSYAVTTTKVYNNSGGTSETDGWINVSYYNNRKIFHVDLDTLASTDVTVVAEGLISDDTSSPMTLFSKTFTVVDTDYSLPICEGIKYIRMSALANGAGTNSISVKFRAEDSRK